jgi:hypothetical protein
VAEFYFFSYKAHNQELSRNSHNLFNLKLNLMILHINNNLVEKQGVFHFKSKNSPFGSIDFSAKSALQATCGSLLQQRGLCLDLRKTLLMRNSGYRTFVSDQPMMLQKLSLT